MLLIIVQLILTIIEEVPSVLIMKFSFSLEINAVCIIVRIIK